MQRIAKFERVSPEIQNAFVSIWIESKMLPLRRRQPSGLGQVAAGAHARRSHYLANDAVSRHKLLRASLSSIRIFLDHRSRKWRGNLPSIGLSLLVRQPELLRRGRSRRRSVRPQRRNRSSLGAERGVTADGLQEQTRQSGAQGCADVDAVSLHITGQPAGHFGGGMVPQTSEKKPAHATRERSRVADGRPRRQHGQRGALGAVPQARRRCFAGAIRGRSPLYLWLQ